MTFLTRRHFVLSAAAAIAVTRAPGSLAWAAEAAPNQALLDLLAMIPADKFNLATASGQIATFADVAGQLKAVGVTAPADTSANDSAIRNWSMATQGLAGPDAIRFA